MKCAFLMKRTITTHEFIAQVQERSLIHSTFWTVWHSVCFFLCRLHSFTHIHEHSLKFWTNVACIIRKQPMYKEFQCYLLFKYGGHKIVDVVTSNYNSATKFCNKVIIWLLILHSCEQMSNKYSWLIKSIFKITHAKGLELGCELRVTCTLHSYPRGVYLLTQAWRRRERIEHRSDR